MKRGDHIKVKRPEGYWHHGIYIGEGRVIHYTGEVVQKAMGLQEPVVRQDSLRTFLGGAEPVVVEHPGHRFSIEPRQVVRRARSRLGERGYNALWNNCEHFATACATGRGFSEQVGRRTKKAGMGAAGGAAAGAAVGMVGGPAGTAAGAIVGALAGFLLPTDD